MPKLDTYCVTFTKPRGEYYLLANNAAEALERAVRAQFKSEEYTYDLDINADWYAIGSPRLYHLCKPRPDNAYARVGRTFVAGVDKLEE